MRFVAAISQGFRTCLKPNATLLRQKLHRVAATKIACVKGPLISLVEGMFDPVIFTKPIN